MWSTGTGKTRAGILAIKAFLTKNLDKVIKIIVPTEHLKLQWIQELNKYKLLADVSVEVINSAVKANTKIDLVVLDECHRYGSDSFYQIFSQRNPTLVLGLSATFNRLDGRHKLLEKYCPVVDVITIAEATKNKWLAPYREYKVLLYPEDIQEYRDKNREFFDSFNVFNFDFNIGMKCLTNVIYRRQYGKSIGLLPAELDAVVFTWNRALKFRKSYVMNHPLKLEVTRKILQARPNSKAITFSGTIAQAEKIGLGYVVHSKKTKKKNQITLDEFKNLSSGVVHTAKSLDEGSDIPGLNLAIILCNTSSKTQKTQRVG
jgi:superfamily II DNA or RNA helicase